MAKVYISGPMSGLPDYNRPAFNEEAQRLQAIGHVPLNPAILPDGLTQTEYMQLCMPMLMMAEHVIMLPGWERSAGAFAEHALAIKLGKPVILPVLHQVDEEAA
ncbi:protein of unknown function [Aeromonas sp. RU39B]|uniref:DUF4406 domain-containing protein n=1 Tax=Aeromonas sp. RU39B TaxID=1907416 RepID=UPI0009548B7E|nr:DUF4406 domain-containing protein [Aeromonas sp. RU39B]SIR65551.1 protein of unknown function [Aeromonas sp. RU39B]